MSEDWAREQLDRRARGAAWADALTASIGWKGRAGKGAMALGAVQFDLPVVFVDHPALMGVWVMSTLTVAPLEDIGAWLTDPGGPERIGRDVLGPLWRESLVADPSVFEARKAEHAAAAAAGAKSLLGFSGLSVGPHMSTMLICRNGADYRQAQVGEPVDLDALRGVDAILCAKLMGDEAACLDFDENASNAFAAIERALGPLAFHHQCASGRLSMCPVSRPQAMSKAWPESLGAWEAMRDARREALDLGIEIAQLPARPGSILRM